MPTWELKIEKGQKKECRMVNLRLPDYKRPRDKHFWDFVIWPKLEEPFYTPKRALITPVQEALKI